MKFLIVSNNYPPLNDGGVPRIVALENYLNSKKIDVRIFTNGNTFPYKRERKIIRIYDPNYSRSSSNAILKLFNLLTKVIRSILKHLKLYIPYYYIWLILSKRKLKNYIQAENFDFVFLSYPSIEILYLGKYLMKKLRNTKFIIDFRDPLVFESAELEIQNQFPKKFKRLAKLENYLVKNSYLTLTVAPQITSYLKNISKNENILTVTNGFDEITDKLKYDDELRLNEEKLLFQKKKFTFLYTGTLSHYDKSRKANYLLDAIKSIPQETLNKIQFIFYGKNFQNDFIEYDSLITQGIIKLRPEVSRHLSTILQAYANALLLVTNTDRTCVTTGKIFEYLKAGKPILGLTKNTHAEQIIISSKTGICSNPNIPSEIKKGILSIMCFDIGLKEDKVISQYSRSNQFDKLWEKLF
jgi:hypothetical protein